MKTIKFAIGLCVSIFLGTSQVMAGAIVSELGSYAVLAGAVVNNQGASTISGNVGAFRGTVQGDLISFSSGQLSSPGASREAAALALYSALNIAPTYTDLTGANLGGMTLSAGNYNFASTAALSTDILTLDAQNIDSPSWNFNIGSSLTISQDASIRIINVNEGATPTVMWNVGSSAYLFQRAEFLGNIVAYASITLEEGSNIRCGRAIALVGSVSMNNNIISRDCKNNDGINLTESNGLASYQGVSIPAFANAFPITRTIVDVPEPAILSVFVLGMMGLASRRFKKQA
jgi:hypothetical protein